MRESAVAESQGVARMNISVPSELKRDMDAAAGTVNWSAVAAAAFRAKLLDLRASKGGDTMDEVITRLKAAAELEANESYQVGHRGGEEWARKYARPKQLRRLSKAVEMCDGNGGGDAAEFVGVLNNGRNSGVVMALAEGLTGRDDIDRREARDFCSELVGDDVDRLDEDDDFARGFIEGALEVWGAVKDHI